MINESVKIIQKGYRYVVLFRRYIDLILIETQDTLEIYAGLAKVSSF